MAAPASYSRRSYVGNAPATTVPLGLGASDGSCAIATATNWPSGSGGDFLVVIDRGNSNSEELAWCSGVSGTTLTFAQRGAQGTAGVAHNPGCTIALSSGTQDLDEANQVVAGVLGQSGAAKGDIPAILSAAGPNTLTRVPIGTSGQLLGVSAGLPAWQYPALTTSSGNIGTNVTLAAGPATTKIFDTASLAVGTWLVNVTITFDSPISTIGTLEFQALVDTATATFAGVTSTGNSNLVTAQEGGEQSASLSFIATVTVAGTLKVNATNSSSTAVATAYTATPVGSFSNATGYTAIRIA